ncbi:MAG: mandelate racemase/muconate lactonizing enzyme family protein [Gammaproteobacteria bacterium]|nr:mandelate racemase/muconate lactonizing enzyme family protein [Gammaproteobacteria bacterium]
MRISEIHVYQKALPIVGGPYVMSSITLESIDTTIVKVVSDSGVIGWGEVAPLGAAYQPAHALGARAAIAELAPALIGESALSPLPLMRRMHELLAGHLYAKAALEVACVDLLARHHGVRVCDLLGGPARDRLPGYCAINIGTPDETARIAADKMQQGFGRIQLKCGGREIVVDIEMLHQVWRATDGKVKLVMDANRGLSVDSARQLSLACQGIPVVLEQPCQTMQETASLRKQVSHPIFLDESATCVADVLHAIELDLCDGFGFKLTRLGGLQAMASVRDICEARNMPHTCDDSWGGDIIAAACLHIAATVKPQLLEGVWTASDYIDEHYDPVNPVSLAGAEYLLPTGIGLGINPDDNLIGALVGSYS